MARKNAKKVVAVETVKPQAPVVPDIQVVLAKAIESAKIDAVKSTGSLILGDKPTTKAAVETAGVKKPTKGLLAKVDLLVPTGRRINPIIRKWYRDWQSAPRTTAEMPVRVIRIADTGTTLSCDVKGLARLQKEALKRARLLRAGKLGPAIVGLGTSASWEKPQVVTVQPPAKH